MATVTLEQVAVPLRAFRLELSLAVDSTVALVGPSGAGKSTVLNAIAGLVKPDAGSIRCDEETWFDADRGVFVPPERPPGRARLPGLRALPAPHRPPEHRVRAAPAGRRVPRSLPDRASEDAARAASRAASVSASRSPARSRATPRSCCSTSRSRHSTPTRRSRCDRAAAAPRRARDPDAARDPRLRGRGRPRRPGRRASSTEGFARPERRPTSSRSPPTRSSPRSPAPTSSTATASTGVGTTALRLEDGTVITTRGRRRRSDRARRLPLGHHDLDHPSRTTPP